MTGAGMGRTCTRFVFLALALGASAAQAQVGVDLNIHLGNQQPPPQVIVREPVAPPPPQVVVEENVDFIYPEDLGFYVAVGVPYDLFYVQDSYFIFRDGRWLRGPSTRGPWVVARYRELPPRLRRYRIERIREYRNREYVVYDRDREHYRGRHFHPGKEAWKEERKAEKRALKEERKEEKRAWKEDRREEKERWKEERHEPRGDRY